MPILKTGQVFSSGDQVTSQKLMDIADLATFDDPSDGSTIQVDSGTKKLKVPDNGITGNELLSNPSDDTKRAVTTNHIKDGAVTAATAAKLDSAATSVLMPIGAIMPYAGSTAPTGYLLCDGAAISRTTYSSLFGIVGITYGAGDASTTFNLPDLRGRVVAGQDDMGGSSADNLTDTQADQLGGTLGFETHTLTTTELPAHTHGGLTDIDPDGGDGGQGDQGEDPNSDYVTSNGDGTVSGSTGGGGPHNNVQPTIILNYIIKT
jgi:microcystin-dependent protein